MQDFLDHLRFERGASERTLDSYGRDLDRLTVFLKERGGLPVAASEGDLQAYFQGPGGEGAPTSVARRMAAVRGLYRFLVREQRRTADPAGRLRSPRRASPLPRLLSIEEVEAILARVRAAGSAGQRDLAMLELLYGCGLRASELVGLCEADVDLEAGLVRCIGKGGKERVVPIGQPAVAAVSRYLNDGRRRLLKGRRRDELYVNVHGRPLTRQGLHHILQGHVRAAGIERPVSAHVFRHSFATHLVRSGADLRSVQEMLGHADLSTTQIYTHVSVEHLREVFLLSHPRARRHDAAGMADRGGSAEAVRAVDGHARARDAQADDETALSRATDGEGVRSNGKGQG